MKKLMILITLMIIVLTGCATYSRYEQSTGQTLNKDYGDGYFTEIYNWSTTPYYHIVYANDTRVMYIIIEGSHYQSGISPLYNADGTLKIYKGEKYDE